MKGNTRRLWSILHAVLVAAMLTFLLPSAALAGGGEVELDCVDIGDPDSEAGHRLFGWGEIEPAASGGNWGGIQGECRVTWEPGSPDKRRCRSALLVVRVPRRCRATKLELEVLDGLADDSFVVYVGCRKVYSYEGELSGSEDWETHTIDLKRCCRCRRALVVRIVATGPEWSGFDTFGQLAVDKVRLLGVRR